MKHSSLFTLHSSLFMVLATLLASHSHAITATKEYVDRQDAAITNALAAADTRLAADISSVSGRVALVATDLTSATNSLSQAIAEKADAERVTTNDAPTVVDVWVCDWDGITLVYDSEGEEYDEWVFRSDSEVRSLTYNIYGDYAWELYCWGNFGNKTSRVEGLDESATSLSFSGLPYAQPATLTRQTYTTYCTTNTVVYSDDLASATNAVARSAEATYVKTYHTGNVEIRGSVAEGDSSSLGSKSHAEGDSTLASGDNSHAEGRSTKATGRNSHAEGYMTQASGEDSHAEGKFTYATEYGAHAAGQQAYATNDYSWVWNGNVRSGTYGAHGIGTFNINPDGGASGVWIGENTLASIIAAATPADYANVSNRAYSAVPTSRTVNGKALSANISLTAADVGAATPTTVTNIVRDLSLGGIWDEELEVWWTPRMSGGSLTYHATTNVNMNAGN